MNVLSINPEVIIQPLKDRVVIYNKQSKKAYSIGKNEYDVLALIDGKRTIVDIHKLVSTYTYDEILRLINEFQNLGFLNNEKSKKSRFNPLMIKIGLVYPKQSLQTKAASIYAFFIKYLSLPLFMLGTILTVLSSSDNYNYLVNISLVSAISIIISITLHEFAHAAVAVKEGAIVAEIGIGLMCCFVPCMYTSIIGVNKISKKSKRIFVYVSGMLLNLGLIGISQLLSIFILPTSSGYLMIFANLNLFLIFINLNYFFKTDTYSILTEIFNDYMLREHSFYYLISLLKKEYNKVSTVPYKKKILYLTYSVSSIVVFIFMLFVGTIALINTLKYILKI